MRDDELLSAYADGVAELTPDERKRVDSLLAADPSLRGDVDDTRALLSELRAMPQDGVEPDWQAMERAIRAAVPERAPRRWWRIAMPAFACVAVAAAVLLVIRPRPETHEPIGANPVNRPVKQDVGPQVEQHTFVYLDGETIDLGAADPAQIDQALTDDEDDGSDVADGDMLASPDLHWVDTLDANKLDRLEKALEGG